MQIASKQLYSIKQGNSVSPLVRNQQFNSRLQQSQIVQRIHLLLRFRVQLNSIQVYLYSTFYDTIVAKQLYRKLSFYSGCSIMTKITITIILVNIVITII